MPSFYFRPSILVFAGKFKTGQSQMSQISFNTTVSRRSETVCKCRRAIKKHGVKITLHTVYASGPLTLTCSVEACAVLDKDVDWAEGRSKFSSNLL